MAKSNTDSNALDAETEITLGLLTAVEGNQSVTQRSVAKELGIALGLTNAYLKRCIKKGFIKVKQVPANRYAYYLTPQGFMEKSRLTAHYLSCSFNFFRVARGQCSELFEACAARTWTRIALCGTSDLAEIATLCARDYPVQVIGVIDPDAAGERFAGLAVFADIAEAGELDAVIVTDLANPQATYDRMVQHLPPERILAPRFAHISRAQPQLME